MVQQRQQQLGRADHDGRSRHQLHRPWDQLPDGDHGGAGRRPLVNNNNNSVGRITTGGVITSYTDPSINGPYGITAGPDGALWFTNVGNYSIGRITTGGVVTNYSDPSINFPLAIAAGPDGALWFTNYGSIGRITTGVTSGDTNPADGIEDSLQPPGTPAGLFSNVVDGRVNPMTGTVMSGSVTIVDLADLTKGVRITAITDAVMAVCGPPSAPQPFTLELSAGMAVTVTCGSVTWRT